MSEPVGEAMIRVAKLKFYREDGAAITWSVKVQGRRDRWLMLVDLGTSASLIGFSPGLI